MNPFEMVVAIIAIITLGRVLSARYGINAWGKRGRRERDLAGPPADALSLDDGARMKAEIDRLGARVQVLERLATDPSKRLSDQIDALSRDGDLPNGARSRDLPAPRDRDAQPARD